MPPTPELLTPAEVARLFRVAPQTVSRWAKGSGREAHGYSAPAQVDRPERWLLVSGQEAEFHTVD